MPETPAAITNTRMLVLVVGVFSVAVTMVIVLSFVPVNTYTLQTQGKKT